MIDALIVSELKQRMRGKRWWILLGVWILLLLGLVALVRAGATRAAEFSGEFVQVGPTMFGSLALFVLGLSCLVVPSLTATAVNGERDRGTLAVLQATLYRPKDVLLAKFSAAFVTAAVFVLATIPLAIWSASEGGVSAVRAVVVYVVLLAMCALFIAIGLAASSLVRRPGLSALAAYAGVFLLTAGLPILFGLSMLSATPEPVTQRIGGQVITYTEPRIGWRWLLLAPDPFVILADAAPRQRSRFVSDPLAVIREGARASRQQSRSPVFRDGVGFAEETPPEPPPLWPVGLAIDVGVIALCCYEVLRKLHVPARHLAPGERVA